MKIHYSIPLFTIIFLSFLLFPNNSFPQTTTVKGKLLDVNGKPNKFALVGLANVFNGSAKDFVNCDANGNYEIKLTKPGVNGLMFFMPSHSSLSIPVINDKDKELTIGVNLAAYNYVDSLNEVGIAGNFNSYNLRSPAPMVKQEDGTYSIEITTDLPVIKYQLIGIEAKSRSINAPESEEFEPDSSGDYRSIVKVKNGKVKIVFDPKNLLISDTDEKVNFQGSDFDEKLFDYTYKYYVSMHNDIQNKMSDFIKAGGNSKNLNYDSNGKLEKLQSEINTEKDSVLKDYLKVIYISFAFNNVIGYDKDLAGSYYESVLAENTAWEVFPTAFFAFYSLLPQDKWDEIQDNFLSNSKSDFIKIMVLENKFGQAKYEQNEEKLTELHELIKKDFANNEEAQQLLSQYPIESKIKVGAEIPDFEVASLDDANIKFSKKDMLGKIYMIDFWAVWCGPCVGEMEHLHKAYEKYKDKGLEILSLSFDGSTDDVVKFRKDKWAMPWKHSFVVKGFQSPIAKDFEVQGIPKPILVGADGKILALSSELRGEDLDKTLAKYFK
jgi:thiol-disulfide isomerase/thioredoxin